jgi:Xaa-Pro aminopeptidase
VRVQWGIEERALTAAAEARRLRDENQRLHERVLELEPAAASARELERSAREAHEAVRDLLAQRRVRLGMGLARPLDVLRRLRR